MSKIKNGELDQYGAELFEQEKFRTSGVEGVNCLSINRTNSSTVTSDLALVSSLLKNT